MTTLDDVIGHFGGIPNLARALRCKPQAIYQWRGRVPKSRAFQIECLTGGKFRADELPTAPRAERAA